MLQAQGLQAFDPYRTLEIDPAAPAALIDEAHRALITRARRLGTSREPIDNARDFLLDERSRAGYDASRGITRAPARQPRGIAAMLQRLGSAAAAPPDDPYRVLSIHPSAGDDIARAAYRVLYARTLTPGGRSALRAALATVLNPHRRARHDTAQRYAREMRAVPAPRAPEIIDLPLQRDAHNGWDGEAQESADAAEDADVATSHLHEAPARAEAQPDSAAPEPEQASTVEAPHRADDTPLYPRIVFVAGPRAGQQIALERDTLTFGYGDEADVVMRDAGVPIERKHARVWRVGARCVLRRLDGEDVRLDGAQMVEPAVPLHDGAEIAIGAHVMRFQLPAHDAVTTR